MAKPIKFLGRTYTYDEKPEDIQRDSRTGDVVKALVDAAMPATRENFKSLQAAKAAQAKQLRNEERAVAELLGTEIADE